MENVIDIKISDIDSFKDHLFKVDKDESLIQLTDSISDNGLLNPIIVRKKENEIYELISRHRRKLAMEMLQYNILI